MVEGFFLEQLAYRGMVEWEVRDGGHIATSRVGGVKNLRYCDILRLWGV